MGNAWHREKRVREGGPAAAPEILVAFQLRDDADLLFFTHALPYFGLRGDRIDIDAHLAGLRWHNVPSHAIRDHLFLYGVVAAPRAASAGGCAPAVAQKNLAVSYSRPISYLYLRSLTSGFNPRGPEGGSASLVAGVSLKARDGVLES